MNLSKEQTQKLKEIFCERVVDSMDLDTLCEIVFDQLMGSYDHYDQKDMQFEVTDYFNDNGEEFNNLLREVSAKKRPRQYFKEQGAPGRRLLARTPASGCIPAQLVALRN